MKRFLVAIMACTFIAASFPACCFSNDQIIIADSAFCFSSDLGPAQIKLSLLKNKRFLKKKNRRFNFGLTTHEYCYIMVKVMANRLSNAYLLSIDNTSLDTISLYRLSESGTKELLYTGGNMIRYETERRYVWHTIPLIINPQPHYYLIAIKALSKNVNVAYKIVRSDELYQIYHSFDKLIYFYIGVIALIIFAALCGSVLFRNSGLIIYAGYVLALTGWILSHYGYLYPAFYPSYPRLNEIVKPLACLLAIFLFLCLITALFKKELQKALLNKIIFVTKLLILAFITAAVIHFIIRRKPYTYTVLNVGRPVLILVSVFVIMLVLAWLYKISRTARIFSLAAALILLMAILQIFSNAGFINSVFLNDHGILITSLLQILILTFGVFHNIWEDKKNKERQLLALEEEQKKTLQMLVQVQDNERKRIAEDLHDSIGPMLAAIKINFLRMVKIGREDDIPGELVTKTENIIDDSITEIRNISHQLMPKGLSSRGLISLLSDYFEDLQAIYKTDISFTHKISASLNKEVQLNLYRIISELVLNAAKHSGSRTIEVSIDATEEETSILIRDTGKGFNRRPGNNESLGIRNAESRTAYLKGRMQIRSSQNKGTSIQISIPHASGS